MRTYLRNRSPGGLYFFTVNLAERQGNYLLVDRIDALQAAFRATRLERPFAMPTWVVLPDHLHCLWRLPTGDADYSTRWRLIKSRFSRVIAATEQRNPSRRAKAERGVWQRRYWEHLVRDEADLRAHIDYIHINPVKHGHAERAAGWLHSSFHQYVHRGILPMNWGCDVDSLRAGESPRKAGSGPNSRLRAGS
jgi:putative transposase